MKLPFEGKELPNENLQKFIKQATEERAKKLFVIVDKDEKNHIWSLLQKQGIKVIPLDVAKDGKSFLFRFDPKSEIETFMKSENKRILNRKEVEPFLTEKYKNSLEKPYHEDFQI